MNVDLKEVGGWVFILIIAYLVIANANNTQTVVGALGGQFTNAVVTLQGRGSAANSVTSSNASTAPTVFNG